MAEELPKRRRPSLGRLQAIKAKHLVQPPLDYGVQAAELYTLADSILKLSDYSDNKTDVKIVRDPSQEIEYVSDGFECVGVIFLFSLGRAQGDAHFVAFVRIGDIWYNGDNEVGFLRRRSSRPSIFMQHAHPNADIGAPVNIVESAICFYVDRSLITAVRGGQDGTKVFGQTDYTCGPDALQTVLMFADGFYEYYNEALYSQIKGLFPEHRPKNMKELKRNIQAADKKKYVSLLTTEGVTAKTRGPIIFLLLMFNRYSYIERLEERRAEQFEVVPNTTRANMAKYCQQLKETYSLFEAVSTGNREMIEALLKCGEDPNIRENYDTPLLKAVENHDIAAVGLLLKYREPPPSAPPSREPLDLEASRRGALVGYSPLMSACYLLNSEIVKVLCEAGANVNKTDVQGLTPLMVIARKDEEVQKTFNEHILYIADTLLRHGADLRVKDNAGGSALKWAKKMENDQLVKLFIERGATAGGRRTRRHRPKRRL